MAAAQGEPPVHEERAKAFFRDRRFGDEQRLELRIAVLLDDEIGRVLVDERLDALVERESANPHVVGEDALLAERVHRLAPGAVAAAAGNEAPRGSALPADLGS